MLRPSPWVHCAIAFLALLPASLAGFLGGAALGLAAGGWIAKSAGGPFIIAIPVGTMGGAAIGAIGMALLVSVVMAQIPARCPRPDCRGTAVSLMMGHFRCSACGERTQIAASGMIEPMWLYRRQERRVERALKELSDRNVEGRVAIAETGTEGALTTPEAERSKQPS